MAKGNRDAPGVLARSHALVIAFALLVALKAKDFVDSFVDNVFVPFVAGVIDRPTFTSDVITFRHAQIYVGAFVATVMSIVIYALLLALAVVLYRRFRRSPTPIYEPPRQAEPREVQLLTEIRDALRSSRGSAKE